MNKIIQCLTKPLEKDLFNFILLFLLISTIDIYELLCKNLIPYAVYIAFYGYITTYYLCFIAEMLPNKVSSIYKKIILSLAILCCVIDIFSMIIYHQRFNQDFAAIIMQTNFAEIKEFFETFISWEQIISMSFLIFILWKFYHILRKSRYKFPKYIQITALAATIIGTILLIRNPLAYKDVFIGKFITILQTPRVPDTQEFLTYPQIIFTKSKQPKNVILLIGESFSKSHSSLYGYNRQTNPKLEILKDSSLLFIHPHTQSPATHTLAALQCVMSTYKPEYRDSISWYKCTSIPEIAQLSGYQTHWISNQSKIGIFDTGTGRYADLCNDQHFVGDKFAGMKRTNYDEEVIPLIQPFLNDTTDHHFFFIHLMGSHSNFINRYPKSFNVFNQEDYLDSPNHQRENLSTYDNSILYNDSVVYEIMNLFSKKEAIVLYFSDHAIDIYESSNTYIAHANVQNPRSVEAGKRIPFMIYTSPLYKEQFPYEIEQIKQCLKQSFRTDDIIYTVMDIIGIEFKGESLEGKSLFRLPKASNSF